MKPLPCRSISFIRSDFFKFVGSNFGRKLACLLCKLALSFFPMAAWGRVDKELCRRAMIATVAFDEGLALRLVNDARWLGPETVDALHHQFHDLGLDIPAMGNDVCARAFRIALTQYCTDNHLANSKTTAKIAEATIARGYLNRNPGDLLGGFQLAELLGSYAKLALTPGIAGETVAIATDKETFLGCCLKLIHSPSPWGVDDWTQWAIRAGGRRLQFAMYTREEWNAFNAEQ